MLSPLWLTRPYTEFLVYLGCAALSGDIDEGWVVADLYIGHGTSFSFVTMSTSEYQSSVSVYHDRPKCNRFDSFLFTIRFSSFFNEVSGVDRHRIICFCVSGAGSTAR